MLMSEEDLRCKDCKYKLKLHCPFVPFKSEGFFFKKKVDHVVDLVFRPDSASKLAGILMFLFQ